MPRVTSYSPAMRRQLALKKAVAAGQAEAELIDRELAEQLGVSPGTFSRHRKNGFQTMRLEEFGAMARMLRFTPEVLAAVFGVSESCGR